MKKTRKGFTLVELLIVIAILGILTAMVQLSGKNATAAAKAATVANGLRTIKTAVGMYVSLNAGEPLSSDYFKNNSTDYLDASNIDSALSINETSNKWYAVYTFTSSDTKVIQDKLKEIAGVQEDGTTGIKMVVFDDSDNASS